MAAEYDLDSKIFKDWPTRVIKSCAARPAIHYCFPQNCGCSSVVEHLLAKEDVASSTLVTRSSPEGFRGWSDAPAALCEGGPPKTAKLRLASRRQNRFGWNAHVTVKDKTPRRRRRWRTKVVLAFANFSGIFNGECAQTRRRGLCAS